MLIDPNPLVVKIIGAAIEVHKALGPGLLESAYDSCLVHEFINQRLKFEKQVPIPVTYKGVRLNCGYRADFVVEQKIILELKSIDAFVPIHTAQMITYLRLLGLRQGLLMNFNVHKLVDGIKSVLL